MRRALLVLGCSATKVAGAVPALACLRYDGPAWRTFRAWMRTQPIVDVDVDRGAWRTTRLELRVLVISAELGVVTATTRIADYDRAMTAARVTELAALDLGGELLRSALGEAPDATLVVGGGLYRQTFERLARGTMPSTTRLARGRGIGELLGELKTWLGALP